MSITLNDVVSLSSKRYFNKGNGKKTVKVGLDNQVPEGRIFPTVDDNVDRAVEDQEDVGDVAELGAPVWPVSSHVM